VGVTGKKGLQEWKIKPVDLLKGTSWSQEKIESALEGCCAARGLDFIFRHVVTIKNEMTRGQVHRAGDACGVSSASRISGAGGTHVEI